jgi:hypothetical protein
MRRLMTLAALAGLAALIPMYGAGAEPRVGPPLHLQLYLFLGENGHPDYARLDVDGRGCLPQDAPASVTVTVDRVPGEVFTAKPNAQGRWGVSIPVSLPLDGVYVVNATCDNYFGETVYPTARTDADQIIGVGAEGGGAGGPPPVTSPVPVPTVVTDPPCAFTTGGCIANTGTRTRSELGIGVTALVVGSLLVLVGRPRRAFALSRIRNAGRHRR